MSKYNACQFCGNTCLHGETMCQRCINTVSSASLIVQGDKLELITIDEILAEDKY